MAQLDLDENHVAKVKRIANEIAETVQIFIDKHSSISIERAVLRLYGVDGVDKDGTPLVNIIIEGAKEYLENGISPVFAAAMIIGAGIFNNRAFLPAAVSITCNISR